MSHLDTVSSARFSPDAQMIVTCSGKSANIWDAQNGRLLANFKYQEKPSSAEFSPDGRMIVTRLLNTTIVWNFTPETRRADEIADILTKKVPLQLKDGVVVPR